MQKVSIIIFMHNQASQGNIFEKSYNICMPVINNTNSLTENGNEFEKCDIVCGNDKLRK